MLCNVIVKRCRSTFGVMLCRKANHAFSGDLTVLVKELKEIVIPLNGKVTPTGICPVSILSLAQGNRVIYDNELEDDRISTVEEDLYEYAQASVHWRPKFDVSLTAEEAKEVIL